MQPKANENPSYPVYVDHPYDWVGRTILVFSKPNAQGVARTCLDSSLVGRQRLSDGDKPIARRLIKASDSVSDLRAWFDSKASARAVGKKNSS